METTRLLTILVMFFGLMVCQLNPAGAEDPMGAAFTYQGRLLDANSVADGLYDFEFALYEDADPRLRTQVGSTVEVNELDVIDGYFTAFLDFNDANAFNGDARWLEIGVRPGDMNDPNEYTYLEPRQELKPTPYALYAENTSGLHAIGDLVLESGSGNIDLGGADCNAMTVHHFGEYRMYDSGDAEGFSLTGVYPVDFTGSSYGTSSELEWDFDDGGTNTSTMMSRAFTEGGADMFADPSGGDYFLGRKDNLVVTWMSGGAVIGIMTKSPEYTLDVNGIAYVSEKVISGAYASSSPLILEAPSGTERMRIDDVTGDVGIGTTSPGAKLDLIGQIKITDGTEQVDRVLTCVGATGLAEWKDATGGGADSDWIISGDNMYSGVPGRVGIGTPGPRAKLQVSSNTTTLFNLQNSSLDVDERAWDFRVENAGNKGELRIRAVTDTGLTETHALSIQRDGDFIVSNGNVGIGTANPGAELEVNGQVKITGGSPGDGKVLTSDEEGLANWQTPAGVTETDPTVLASVKDGITWSEISSRPAGLDDGDDVGITSETDPTVLASVKDGVSWGEVTGIPSGFADGVDDVGAGSDSDWAWSSGSGLTGDIYHDGKVGIRTESPDHVLSVSLPSGGFARFGSESNSRVLIGWNANYGIITSATVGGGNKGLLFCISHNPRMLINWAGNVGIGTMSPAYKLDVNGDIRAIGSVYYGGTEGNADGTAYTKPDYVFEEGYNAMSTEQVEEYLIKENHLPWMTSVKQEKEENGDAVDMTRMAFETVETAENIQLQVIELNKLIKEQAGMIKAQQNRIEAFEEKVEALERMMQQQQLVTAKEVQL